MALSYYELQTQRLLQNPPGAPSSLYNLTDLDSYINTARGQLAGEAECVRFLATLTASIGVSNYDFSSINTGVSATTGIQGVINVRSVMYGVGSGFQWIAPRSWEWFQLFNMNNPVPTNGAPMTWSQFAQGTQAPGVGGAVASNSGSLYIDPPPDFAYNLLLDCSCYPVALADDTTVEAIPYMWTDAIPFYAAWYALLSSQTSARRQDAEAYYGYYQQYVQRARTAANPSVNRSQYEQAPDPVQMFKLPQVRASGGQQ